jgi:ribosome-binding protein aMBF1 (putative translation factor)
MRKEMGIQQAPTNVSNSDLNNKIQELSQSVSKVYKYELLTTNQYMKQMELILDIFNELSNVISN